jgi:integrative and conjugative element protein (TIGR02256 family)
MSETEFLPLLGEEIERGMMTVAKALALAELLGAGYPFVTLVACWHFPDAEGGIRREGVILDVEVEVSQRPVNDIRRVERIAAAFRIDDRTQPEAVSLRLDFPHVPHLNITPWERPRSLCLSDRPYSEDRLNWTPSRFVEAVRGWLALTAAGALHQDDQPLEPLLGGATAKIILPYDLFRNGSGAEPIFCHGIDQGGTGDARLVIIARREDAAGTDSLPSGTQSLPFVAIPLEVEAPMTHGVIRWEPSNLALLHEFLMAAGKDLLADLRGRLRIWAENPAMLARRPILVVALQKRRTQEGPVETTETWAFLADKTLEEIRVAIGVHGEEGGYRGLLLNVDNDKQGEDVGLSLLLPYYTLAREKAALFNAYPSDDTEVVAIGLGALGSQVFDNLVRGGFGRWTLVDDDHTLPHNLARHELHGSAIGFAKVIPLAVQANRTIDGPDVATPLVMDVLEPGEQSAAFEAACARADLLLDMSASVAVARHLARDRDESGARRVSLFLNPSGTDLVLLAEDAGRRHRLDALEMQYYRALVHEVELADHLVPNDGRVRYGRSCRDVTRLLPQEQVALHAAAGSRAVRTVQPTPHAQIRIWRAGGDLSVKCVSVPVAPVVEQRLGDWTLVTDAIFLDRVKDLRAAKLPVETGGVLLGSFDTQRQIVYVTDLVPSPPDSVERTTLYIRGSQGLRDRVTRVESVTAGWLRYVGEWHSHPRGVRATPSGDDRKLFGWLGEMMAAEGLPPLMLIVGEAGHLWCLGEIPAAPREEEV